MCSVFQHFFFFFHLWVVLYVHFYLPLLRFQCLCVRGFNVSKRHFTFVRVPQSRGFAKRNVEMLAWFADAWFQSCRPCRSSGPQLRTSEAYGSKLTSSCLEQRRFSLCVRIHRHSNPTAGGGGGLHGRSQLVLCLFLPSNTCRKNKTAPEVWSSMQLIYYPRRCNTTGIQETANVLMAFRLTAFQFSSPYAKACFSSCPPFICPSTVRKTAALKGNYFIPKHGRYSDCGAVFLNVYRESDHRCALREWRRVTDSASKLLLLV